MAKSLSQEEKWHRSFYLAFWRAANRDKVRYTLKRYHKLNRARRLAYMAAYYQSTREERLAYARAYHKRYPEKRRLISHRRKALKVGNGGTHTESEWADLLLRTGYQCLACGVSGLLEPLTRDHVIPLSRGGINGIDNIQPLCGPCNLSKGTKSTDYRCRRV